MVAAAGRTAPGRGAAAAAALLLPLTWWSPSAVIRDRPSDAADGVNANGSCGLQDRMVLPGPPGVAGWQPASCGDGVRPWGWQPASCACGSSRPLAAPLPLPALPLPGLPRGQMATAPERGGAAMAAAAAGLHAADEMIASAAASAPSASPSSPAATAAQPPCRPAGSGGAGGRATGGENDGDSAPDSSCPNMPRGAAGAEDGAITSCDCCWCTRSRLLLLPPPLRALSAPVSAPRTRAAPAHAAAKASLAAPDSHAADSTPDCCCCRSRPLPPAAATWLSSLPAAAAAASDSTRAKSAADRARGVPLLPGMDTGALTARPPAALLSSAAPAATATKAASSTRTCPCPRCCSCCCC